MDQVSGRGHLAVLEWWKGNGLDIQFSACSLISVARIGHLDAVKWWLEMDLGLTYSDEARCDLKKKFVRRSYLRQAEAVIRTFWSGGSGAVDLSWTGTGKSPCGKLVPAGMWRYRTGGRWKAVLS
ncbi:hypothetical protein HDV00_002613 [Rhizophlyctis rosea]|nr:hypothetical protein HDV00_002613 [Rhizophlyctis rosea]